MLVTVARISLADHHEWKLFFVFADRSVWIDVVTTAKHENHIGVTTRIPTIHHSASVLRSQI